jgi:hypothetical protein
MAWRSWAVYGGPKRSWRCWGGKLASIGETAPSPQGRVIFPDVNDVELSQMSEEQFIKAFLLANSNNVF